MRTSVAKFVGMKSMKPNFCFLARLGSLFAARFTITKFRCKHKTKTESSEYISLIKAKILEFDDCFQLQFG